MSAFDLGRSGGASEVELAFVVLNEHYSKDKPVNSTLACDPVNACTPHVQQLG